MCFFSVMCSVPVKTIFECDIEGGCRVIALSHDARYLATISALEQQVLGVKFVLVVLSL